MSWTETTRWWGSTVEERERTYPCDALLPDHDEAWFRAVTVHAAPAVVFAWLCQLRAAPYSYDWIDNFGRRSPRVRSPELTRLEPGQRFMTIFDLVSFEPDVHVTLRLRGASALPLAVSYALHPSGDGDSECRMVAKLALDLRRSRWRGLVRAIGPTADWIMMRRQLLNLKALAEAEARAMASPTGFEPVLPP